MLFPISICCLLSPILDLTSGFFDSCSRRPSQLHTPFDHQHFFLWTFSAAGSCIPFLLILVNETALAALYLTL